MQINRLIATQVPRLLASKQDARQYRFFSHVPVMANEIVQLLRPENGKVYIDMTFGAGGHTRKLLDSNKSIRVIAVDRDPVAIRHAHQLAKEVAIKSERLNIRQSVTPIHGKFSDVIKHIHLSGVPYGSVHGIIFDLGASSMQFDTPERGFALSTDGPLDMRMDTSNASAITAEDVVNNLSEEELALVFKIYGDERRSRKMANAIIDGRTLLGRIRTTKELARITSSVTQRDIDLMGRFAHGGTKVFQALRIFVNNELNELNYAIEKIREFLIPAKVINEGKSDELVAEPYGVMAVLTFHSLEDKIVKRNFTGEDPTQPDFKYLSQHDRIQTNVIANPFELEETLDKKKIWRHLPKHVMKPTETEIAANPRSRSAKLRAALRIDR